MPLKYSPIIIGNWENIWGGLIFVSCGSVLSFIFYHMKCEFVAEPMQLAENEIVIRNAVGETVILRWTKWFIPESMTHTVSHILCIEFVLYKYYLSLDNMSGPGSVSQNSVVSVRVLPTYDEIFNKSKEQAFWLDKNKWKNMKIVFIFKQNCAN